MAQQYNSATDYRNNLSYTDQEQYFNLIVAPMPAESIGVRGKATKTSGTTSVSISQGDFDVAPQTGDFLVAFLETNDLDYQVLNGYADTVSDPAGWSVGTATLSDRAMSVWLGYKAWSSGDTSYTWTYTPDSTPGMAVTVVALKNASTADITSANNSMITTIPSITAANADEYYLVGMAGTAAVTSITGMTTLSNLTDGSGMAGHLIVAGELRSTSGATGTRAINGTDAFGMQILVR